MLRICMRIPCFDVIESTSRIKEQTKNPRWYLAGSMWGLVADWVRGRGQKKHKGWKYRESAAGCSCPACCRLLNAESSLTAGESSARTHWEAHIKDSCIATFTIEMLHVDLYVLAMLFVRVIFFQFNLGGHCKCQRGIWSGPDRKRHHLKE